MLLLGFFGGPSITGVYKVAISATHVHDMLNKPITAIAYPEIVRARQEGPQRLRSVIEILTLISSFIIVTSGIGLFVFARPIIELVSDGAAYLDAAGFFRIMIVGNLVTGLLFWTGYLIMANGRVWIVNRIHLVRSVLGLGLMAALIPTLGALGASWIYVFNQSFVSIAALIVCLREGYISFRPRIAQAPSESSTS
jgi:O-antigen/teichoic acid export membrane protein